MTTLSSYARLKVKLAPSNELEGATYDFDAIADSQFKVEEERA